MKHTCKQYLGQRKQCEMAKIYKGQKPARVHAESILGNGMGQRVPNLGCYIRSLSQTVRKFQGEDREIDLHRFLLKASSGQSCGGAPEIKIE